MVQSHRRSILKSPSEFSLFKSIDLQPKNAPASKTESVVQSDFSQGYAKPELMQPTHNPQQLLQDEDAFRSMIYEEIFTDELKQRLKLTAEESIGD